MIKKFPSGRMEDLFSAIAQTHALYLPVEQKGRVNFGKWGDGEKVRLDALNTAKSAKDLFFPQSEELAAFKVEGKSITITPAEAAAEPFVVFGVRACDAKSFEILDMVFLNEPVDTFYKMRREKGVVVTLACAEPEETCFCTVFGIDATEPGGDIAAWQANGFIYLKPVSEKGAGLIEKLASMLEDADEAELTETKKAAKDVLARLPLGTLDIDTLKKFTLKETFEQPIWQQLSQACIGCGTCTFVCPTCQCYDIRDFDTGHGVCRYRCWDSCMYSDFTRMAHGNPRKTQLERFRQRFMHKLVYFPENNGGVYSCVGCGRCLSACPVSMNIAKVIKALGAQNNGK